MKNTKDDVQAYKEWDFFVKKVQEGSHLASLVNETKQAKAKRVAALLQDYNAFVQYYFPHYTTDPETGHLIGCAPFHIEAADTVAARPTCEGVIAWSRDFAKSVHFDIFLPLFRKCINPAEVGLMVLIGENETVAKRLLQPIQAELMFNERYIHDFGKQFQFGDWSTGDFSSLDGCSFVALGLGQPVRGLRKMNRRPTWVNIDDIENLKKTKNRERIREDVDWLYRTLMPTMSKGFARLFIINNRCVKGGFVDTVMEERPKWWHSVVNALDKRGTPTWKARFDKAYYERVRANVGEKAFQSEYMNNPQRDGGVFDQAWEVWEMPEIDWTNYDALVMGCDPSFSTMATSDYTAIRLWAFKGPKRICLKSYVRNTVSIQKALEWWHDFYYKLPEPVRKKVKCICEANGMQKILIKEAREKIAHKYGVLMPMDYKEYKEGSKADRISSMISVYEAGFVAFNTLEKHSADMIEGNAQVFDWNDGVRLGDDTPDCDEMCWREGEKARKNLEGGWGFGNIFNLNNRGGLATGRR